MAICKHNSSKNGFAGALEYLTMQHDAKGRLLLDDGNFPIPRETYLINGINCLPETFASLCLQDRLRFQKGCDKNSVDTHQYIISFAPSDVQQGLTVEEAQRFGVRFARQNFPGHRILVCTHPDGGQKSGNIHVHIVLSALRYEDRPPDSRFMRLRPDGSVKPSEYLAGCAHQDTAALRKHLLSQVNGYCLSHGYMLCPEKASNKISQKEYLLKQKGIETKNDQLRRAITDAAGTSSSWEEFTAKLKTGYTQRVPAVLPIPYPQRQKLWNKYRELSGSFRTWDKKKQAFYRQQLDEAFLNLKNTTVKPRKAMLRQNIAQLKQEQAQLRLFRKTYQAYAKAASLALKSQNLEDAVHCLEQMEELSRRQEGYWEEGLYHSSSAYSLLDGTSKTKITWRQNTPEELSLAEQTLLAVQEEAILLADAAKESQEVPMPIEVKLTRGEISFRHPDSERWVRGKRLGDGYTLKSLGIYPPITDKFTKDYHQPEPVR